MRKIKYPFLGDKLKKDKFDNTYYCLIKNRLDETTINNLLQKIDTTYNLKILLTGSFLELLEMQNKIEKSKHKKDLDTFFSTLKKKQVKYVYENLQPAISGFFMEQKIDLQSCHYCNIDFINTFEEHYQFSSKEEFILKAPLEILALIDEISNETAKKIIKYRLPNQGLFFIKKLLTKNIQDKIFKWINKSAIIGSSTIDLNNMVIKKNHYTLDHVLPKNKFPFLSLSFYNLVPSCYSCNSKFKHIKEFTIDEKILSKISPTSEEFKLDEMFKFKLDFNVDEPDFEDNIRKINQIEDIKIEIENINSLEGVNEFIEIFKLKSRYEFHKKISFDLIENRKQYPDSALDEIAKIFHDNDIYIDKNTFKKQIFGKDIFEANTMNVPFEKYKKDIAKQIGLIS